MAESAPPPPPGQQKPQSKDDPSTKKGFKRYKWEFKDSNKEFWLGGHAEVKILSLVCLIIGLSLFETVATHPILILLLTMEISFIAFFIFLYTFALNRYIPFIYWPMTDLFNDLFSCVFLVGGIYFASISRNRFPTAYVTAMIFMLLAAFFAVVDLCLQRRNLKGKKLRKHHLLAPDKDGKMPDPGLQLLLEAAKEEEERKEKERLEREEKERKEREMREKKAKKKEAKAAKKKDKKKKK